MQFIEVLTHLLQMATAGVSLYAGLRRARRGGRHDQPDENRGGESGSID